MKEHPTRTLLSSRPFRLHVVLLLFLSCLVGASAPTADAEVAFCKGSVVRDYRMPFKRMPNIRRIPATGHLPFAPADIFLTFPSNPVLVPREGPGTSINYGFEFRSAKRRIVTLNWIINVQVSRVNRDGRVIMKAGLKRRKLQNVTVRQLEQFAISFGLPRREAFYRVDLSFKSLRGNLLGKYGQYVRVMRPTRSVKLETSPGLNRPGEDIFFRLKNFGTARTSYGEPFAIEKQNGAYWSPYLTEADLGPWRRWLRTLPGGTAGRCQSFTVPLGTEAGRYRVKKALPLPASAVDAEFEVAP
jgi:hypothetical protein